MTDAPIWTPLEDDDGAPLPTAEIVEGPDEVSGILRLRLTIHGQPIEIPGFNDLAHEEQTGAVVALRHLDIALNHEPSPTTTEYRVVDGQGEEVMPPTSDREEIRDRRRYLETLESCRRDSAPLRPQTRTVTEWEDER